MAKSKTQIINELRREIERLNADCRACYTKTEDEINSLTAENEKYRQANIKCAQAIFGLEDTIDRLTAENKPLKQFAREIILEMCWDIPTSTMGDLCGGEVQDFAEKLGLIKPHIITEKEVNDYPGEEFDVGETIYVLSEILEDENSCYRPR